VGGELKLFRGKVRNKEKRRPGKKISPDHSGSHVDKQKNGMLRKEGARADCGKFLDIWRSKTLKKKNRERRGAWQGPKPVRAKSAKVVADRRDMPSETSGERRLRPAEERLTMEERRASDGGCSSRRRYGVQEEHPASWFYSCRQALQVRKSGEGI